MALQKAIQITITIINKLKEKFGRDYSPSVFYASITNDIKRRMSEHKTARYHYILANQGFNVGTRPANGGSDESKYVYAYRITPSTIEDTNA